MKKGLLTESLVLPKRTLIPDRPVSLAQVIMKKATRGVCARLSMGRIGVLVVCLWATAATSEAEQFGDFTYTINNAPDTNTVTIIRYTGFLDSVAIPPTINGKSVTHIGDDAFCDLPTPLRSVTIPDSVTSIGVEAFANCTGLSNVTIPASVTSIGSRAFYECTSLTSVTMTNGVIFIGHSAFANCTSLSNVTLPDSVTSIGDSAFNYCTNLTSVTIPDSVTSIGSYAFYYCTSLTSVTIPDSVTSIGDGAFLECHGLTSVTIGNSITSIGNDAFRICTGLISLNFKGNAPGLGSSVFSGCDNATVYYLLGTMGWTNPWGGRPTVLLDLDGDLDGDGLSNSQELQLGTDPQNPDSDGDGAKDGLEVRRGTDPLDPESKPVLAMPWLNLLLE